MKVSVIHSSQGGDGPYDCASGTCPTIYETDRGTILFQGFILNAEEKAALNIPHNEDVVEVSKKFMERFVANGKL